MKRRDLIKKLPLLGVPPFMYSCGSGVSMGPTLAPQYLISTSMILQEMLPHFPFNHSLPAIGNFSLSSPVLSMAPEINKVRVGLNFQTLLSNGISSLLGMPLNSGASSYSGNGKCSIACGIKYDKKTRGIYLKEPVLESLDLLNLPSVYATQAKGIINTLAPQFLEQRPVHTLEQSFAVDRIRSINVRGNGIALGLGI